MLQLVAGREPSICEVTGQAEEVLSKGVVNASSVTVGWRTV